MRLTRREALAAGAAAGLALTGCEGRTLGGGAGPAATIAPGARVEDRMIMANWVDYTSPDNLKGFQRSYGVKIVESGFGSDEELVAKMGAGGSRFDLIVPSTSSLDQLGRAGLLMELDPDLIPNLRHVKPVFREKGVLNPAPRFGVVKDYGILSFYWRTAVVKERPRTLKDVFDLLPRYRDARVNFIESGGEIVATALTALGYSLNSVDERELEEAKRLLSSVKGSVDTISTQYLERGSRGEIDIGLGYNGDVLRIKAARAEKGDEIAFLIPEGKAEAFVGFWSVPANARSPVAAHKWIDYVLDPRRAARESAYTMFGSPVGAAAEHLPRALRDDPILNIPEAALRRYEVSRVLSPQGERLRNRVFTEFKAA